MGRDEHRSKKNNRPPQTPKHQLKKTTENDVEFSEELGSAGDRNMQSRIKAMKEQKEH